MIGGLRGDLTTTVNLNPKLGPKPKIFSSGLMYQKALVARENVPLPVPPSAIALRQVSSLSPIGLGFRVILGNIFAFLILIRILIISFVIVIGATFLIILVPTVCI